jgi:hypothetical protein
LSETDGVSTRSGSGVFFLVERGVTIVGTTSKEGAAEREGAVDMKEHD